MKTVSGVPSRAFDPMGETVPTPVEHLRNMAEECRDLAHRTQDPAVRRELIQMAERFERLAQVREQTGARSRKPPPKSPPKS